MSARTTWRWVICRERIDSEDQFNIRELYTDASGGISWTEEPITPVEDTFLELADTLSRIASASGQKVLDLTLDPPRLIHPMRLEHGVRP